MIDQSPECARAVRSLEASLRDLSLVSHADSGDYNPSPAAEPKPPRWRLKSHQPTVPHLGQHHVHGGDTMTPTGGISRMDDRAFDYRQKSHEFFANRFERWKNDKHRVYGETDVLRLRVEVEDARYDWKHTPVVAGVQLEKKSFLWKCEVADAPGTAEQVGIKYGVGERTVERYRAQYRGVRRQAA